MTFEQDGTVLYGVQEYYGGAGWPLTITTEDYAQAVAKFKATRRAAKLVSNKQEKMLAFKDEGPFKEDDRA